MDSTLPSSCAITLESMSQAVWYNRWTLLKFERYLRGEILEVGCGIGNFTKALARYGRVWAIDINPSFIANARKKHHRHARVGLGDIEKGRYFFRKRRFDTVVCLNVLEHIRDDRSALLNIAELLKPRGYAVVLVPDRPSLFGSIDQSIGHFRRYDAEDLRDKLAGGSLTILSMRRINMLGALGWWFAGRILKRSRVSKWQLLLFNAIAPILLPCEDIIHPPIGTSLLVIAQKS